ncbi:unnamed protein product, partial [Ectocarpus fasciculatus]
VPSPTVIKSRIESLIDREYLERDRNDSGGHPRWVWRGGGFRAQHGVCPTSLEKHLREVQGYTVW